MPEAIGMLQTIFLPTHYFRVVFYMMMYIRQLSMLFVFVWQNQLYG